jgi:hypothetical protein
MAVSITVTPGHGEKRTVPIEKLHPNLRSYKFESTFRSNPNCFDCASNHLTPDYLLMLPRVINVCALYDRRIFMDLGAGSWQSDNLGGLQGLGGWVNAYPGTQGRFGDSSGVINWSWSKLGFFHEYHEFDYMHSVSDEQAKQTVRRPSWVHAKTLFKYHNRLVDAGKNIQLPNIDIITFLQQYKKSDFVHVKMDIENCEWHVLGTLIESGAIDLIDELTLEVHFLTDDPSWQAFLKAASIHKLMDPQSPCPGEHTREEAFALLQQLRDLGVYMYTHTYPDNIK